MPSRGLIGYQGEFLTDTRGTGIMAKLFHSYVPHKGPMPERRNGVLISNCTGEAVAYALNSLEDRGILFVRPQDKIYEGMVIGIHSRENDLVVNVCNAPSPAATASLNVGQLVVDKLAPKLT